MKLEPPEDLGQPEIVSEHTHNLLLSLKKIEAVVLIDVIFDEE